MSSCVALGLLLWSTDMQISMTTTITILSPSWYTHWDGKDQRLGQREPKSWTRSLSFGFSCIIRSRRCLSSMLLALDHAHLNSAFTL